jgi:hypothetical protein
VIVLYLTVLSVVRTVRPARPRVGVVVMGRGRESAEFSLLTSGFWLADFCFFDGDR